MRKVNCKRLDSERIYMILRKSISAGLAISIGCIAFLSVGGGALGAFLFSIGLILVCVREMDLFTGKVCYVRRWDSKWKILIILTGNLVAAIGMGLAMARVKPILAHSARELCETKLEEGLLVIPLGILCNIMIYFAVDTFYSGIRGLIVVLCVMVFITCGFEHCIANAFYLALGGTLFTYDGILYLILNIFGNAIGGIAIRQLCG